MLKSLFRKKTLNAILKQSRNEEGGEHSLHKNLKLRDLTAFGIAAIIGAGIFSTIGNAAAAGGPGVSLLFVITAIACAFSAMCYAEFASRIPISGSAYTYAYASFGELFAWIIGWGLIMEYAVGNIAVAISWSGYFTSLMDGIHINGQQYFHIPEWATCDYTTAHDNYIKAVEYIKTNNICSCELVKHMPKLYEGYQAWLQAPVIAGIRCIIDIPAFTIVVLITALVYRGIKESKTAGNLMVLLKLLIIIFVISVGAAFVNVEYYNDFFPEGLGGMMKGVSGVFFAYIGFDAISTTAEECENPQRDLPKSMFLSLAICTVLYVLISLVLTGMVNYKELGVDDPLAYVFDKLDLKEFSLVISISAVIAMASVLLVFQMGQPRIWMSMSRDGLLSKKFSKIHKKYRTPSFATIITGIVVAVPSLFFTLTDMTDLTSIGTMFAFVLVCGGIIILNHETKEEQPENIHYKVPYYNSKYILPFCWAIVITLLIIFNMDGVKEFFNFTNNPKLPFLEKIPLLMFIILSIFITIRSFIKNYSFIPVFGLLSNFYLMSELGYRNWVNFSIWLVVGLFIYFLYSRKKSKLNQQVE